MTGVRTHPLENHKNIGILSNAGPVPLKLTKLPNQHSMSGLGVQWLSGRVLDSRPRGHRFEPHRRHWDVVLEQDTFILA